ncbi:hypothetical protein OPV22_007628 [Ensete ventricosum]|uniref:Uncharacterized protein n=1 Tax=Ensete ventricosum TaxID=4639 RepID=A0AAV8Q7L6_ENSVE|nr:hypothetical protein OPV22_007628 [Ensete ventricosum]
MRGLLFFDRTGQRLRLLGLLSRHRLNLGKSSMRSKSVTFLLPVRLVDLSTSDFFMVWRKKGKGGSK